MLFMLAKQDVDLPPELIQIIQEQHKKNLSHCFIISNFISVVQNADSEKSDIASPWMMSIAQGYALALSSQLPVKHSESAFSDVVQKLTNFVHLAESSVLQASQSADKAMSMLFCDPQTQRLLAKTDALGLERLYFCHNNEFIAVSDSPAQLCELLSNPSELSSLGMACWLAGGVNPDKSLYAQIQVLPAGHVLSVENNTLQIQRYWDIQPQNRLDGLSDSDYEQRFKQIFTQSVARCVGDDQERVAGQLSGGMDSSSVCATAKELLDQHHRPFLTVSHTYKNSEQCDERDAIADSVKMWRVENHQLAVDNPADMQFLAQYPTQFAYPGYTATKRYIEELDALRAMNIDALLTGNGGDELCWGHSSAYTMRFMRGELAVVPEVIRACKQTGVPVIKVLSGLFFKPLVRKWLGRHKRDSKQPFPVAPWLTDHARELVFTQGLLENPFDFHTDPVGHYRYQAIKTTSTFNNMISYNMLARPRGIAMRHPFWDADLVEFSFAIPASQLIKGAYPKWLLRRAMRDKLPESVCWNTAKVTFDQHFSSLIKQSEVELAPLLFDGRLQQTGLVNEAALQQSFKQISQGQQAHHSVDLLFTILLRVWLLQHHE